MKKIFLLLFIAVGAIVNTAKADNAMLILYGDSYPAPYNNFDTFTFYVSSDGYLHYSLIDNGPGGTDYESGFGVGFIDPITHENTYVSVVLPGGGNIVGSVFIGTSNTSLSVLQHGAGYITVPDYYGPKAWDVDVIF